MSKQVITWSDRAADRVKEIMAQAKEPIVGVRVGVASGGCAGMSYVMEYAKKTNPNDEIVEDKGVKVLIDPISEMFLIGTTIDYISEDYEKSIFENKFIFIPDKNLATSCGCGVSFNPRN